MCTNALPANMYRDICAYSAHRGQLPLELELWNHLLVVSHHVVLGIKPESSGGAASALSC